MFREALRFRDGCVATPHYLASVAGLEVLARGGNALDAAVAANLTLGVVAPHLCGFGGDLFALVWRDGDASGYLGGGRAPEAATLDAVAERVDGDTMPTRGPMTVIVPGAVQGWFDLLDRFGTREFGDLAARARGYAAGGFPLTQRGDLVLRFMADEYRDFPQWQAIYGAAADHGLLRQPDLARTIDTLAADGPDAYYRGEIGEAIGAFVEEQGGLLRAGDLAAHEGAWVPPLRAGFRDLEVLELPPPTQGITALEALRITDHVGPLPDDPLDRQHLLIEVMKAAIADRDAYVTDPEHMRVAPEALIADEWTAERAAALDRSRAASPSGGREIPGGTAYLCAADADGMLVSLIQTNFNEFGSGLTVPGWGINLHNRGRAFSLDPEHVNVWAPRKRTLHTLIPALALRDGAPELVFGTMGADAQAQVHLQMLVHVIDEGLDLQAALDAPRWRVVPGEWTLMIEERFDDGVLPGLEERGHRLQRVGKWFDYMGYAQAIRVEEHGYAVASDARAEGAALGI